MLTVAFLLIGLLAFANACGSRPLKIKERIGDETLDIPKPGSLTAMITKYEVLPKEELAIILGVGRGFNGWLLVRVTSAESSDLKPVGSFLKSQDKVIAPYFYDKAATVEISTMDQDMEMATVIYQAPPNLGEYIVDVYPKLKNNVTSWARIEVKRFKVVKDLPTYKIYSLKELMKFQREAEQAKKQSRQVPLFRYTISGTRLIDNWQ